MTREDFDLVQGWIDASGKRAQESDFQEPYKHGWYGGLTSIEAAMDDYRKAQKRDKIVS